jgi:protein-tyrosine phosphatase
MNPKLYWIDGPWSGKLAISARPRGGDWLEDEIQGWRRAGVDGVVSLLTPPENKDLQLNLEESLSRSHGLRFIRFPVEDRSVPISRDEAATVIAQVDDLLRQGQNVAIHCRQGIGRSGMFAAALLATNGRSPDEAMELISQVRGLPVPETPEQREWVKEFSKTRIGSATPIGRASMK